MSNESDFLMMPDWAVERARTALDMGMKVPEAQKLLVSGGLSPSAAESVVMAVITGRVRETAETERREESTQLTHRVLSAVFAVACVLMGYLYNEWASVGRVLLFIAFPLVCIWFSDMVAKYWSGPIETPKFLVRLGGWIALLAYTVYRMALLTI